MMHPTVRHLGNKSKRVVQNATQVCRFVLRLVTELGTSFRRAKQTIAKKRSEFILSVPGKTISGGLVTIFAAGYGSFTAEAVADALAGTLVTAGGGTAVDVHHAAKIAGVLAALASGVVALPVSIKSVNREEDHSQFRLEVLHPFKAIIPELRDSFKSALVALRGSGWAMIAAAFLGGSFAAVIVSGGRVAVLAAGAAGAAGSAVGAAVTAWFTGLLEYPVRLGRARARRALNRAG